jgi:hypothetical protein
MQLVKRLPKSYSRQCWNKAQQRPKRRLAESEVKQTALQQPQYSAYKCGVCGAWHLGRPRKGSIGSKRRDDIMFLEVGGTVVRDAILAENLGSEANRISAISLRGERR